MKTLKIAALSLFITIGSAVFAQGGATELAEKAKLESSVLTKKLDLDSAQSKTVYNAALTRAKLELANHKQYKSDETALKTANKKANTDFETSVKSTLTPAQKAKYEQELKNGASNLLDKEKGKL